MRMKKTMLLVSSSPSTSVGLRSYLTHIFGRYIKLEARLADDVTSELMEQFDLVLFASKGAARALETSMTPKIHFLICIRTFNFTYLNKILSIPPNSDVYLVNDSQALDVFSAFPQTPVQPPEWTPPPDAVSESPVPSQTDY